MITYGLNAIKNDKILNVYEIRGLSTDTKPLDVGNGSAFIEMDTSDIYFFDGEHNTWLKFGGGSTGGGGSQDTNTISYTVSNLNPNSEINIYLDEELAQTLHADSTGKVSFTVEKGKTVRLDMDLYDLGEIDSRGGNYQYDPVRVTFIREGDDEPNYVGKRFTVNHNFGLLTFKGEVFDISPASGESFVIPAKVTDIFANYSNRIGGHETLQALNIQAGDVFDISWNGSFVKVG